MPIIIDVTPLLKSLGKKMEIDETESVSYPEDELNLSSPVNIKAQLVYTGDEILLKGSVSTRVKLNCSRCLKEFDHPVSFEIEEAYSRKKPRSAGKSELQLTAKDLVFEIELNNTINVSEAVRQNLITELPIKPLCDEKCSII